MKYLIRNTDGLIVLRGNITDNGKQYIKGNLAYPYSMGDYTIQELTFDGVYIDKAYKYVNGDIVVANQTIIDNYITTQLEKVKEAKIQEIDNNTKNKIIALIGNDVKQRNMTAKAVQLTKKMVDGTITTDEQTMLDNFNATFEQVEIWINEGNALEDKINACTTIEEVEGVII